MSSQAGYTAPGSHALETTDHGEYYRWPRSPGRAAAIAAHLHPGIEGAQTWAERAGLRLHVPPGDPRAASWWSPGRTALVVYTRPEIERVEWPDL